MSTAKQTFDGDSGCNFTDGNWIKLNTNTLTEFF